MESQYLLLWFEAPLQSWGFDSKFGRRDSLKFPTRSGVLGLLCAALGYSGEQKEFLARISGHTQLVISYNRRDRNSKMVVSEPLLMDFQMVGSGYDDQDPWQSLLIPKTSEGKKAVGGGSKMTYRYYLQDARFAIVLQCSPTDTDSFSSALKSPVYDLYFGRKNCVPTEFIFQGVFPSESEAIAQAAELAEQKNCTEAFRVVEGDSPDGSVMTLNDIPLQFGEVKKYRDRRVTVIQKSLLS